MKITGPGGIRPSQAKRGGKSGKSSDAKFTIPTAAGETSTASVSSAGPISSIEAVLALQGVPSPTDERKAALDWGQDMLDKLDQVRHGLLLGTIPVAQLQTLRKNLEGRHNQVSDPKLVQILAEIEVRVAVELAKLGY